MSDYLFGLIITTWMIVQFNFAITIDPATSLVAGSA